MAPEPQYPVEIIGISDGDFIQCVIFHRCLIIRTFHH
jgi:hypothetical protein